MTSRYYCFTLNNYDEAELVSLRNCLSSEKVRYAIFGREVGKEGTPHLQGYVCFKNSVRRVSVSKMVGIRAHIEACKGSEAQNRTYCSKGGDIEEFGKSSEAGKRNDLDAFVEEVKSGNHDVKALRDSHRSVFARYPRFCLDILADHQVNVAPESFPLRPWQIELNSILIKPPDDREIIFVVDKDGDTGKSWFCKYYMSLHDKCFYIRPTKHADMAYALPDDVRVVFLDCTRQQVEHFPYSFVESVKDGLVFSSKYESRMKTLGKVHVVVMMNSAPDETKLSIDRFKYIDPKLN